ncbi:hypothetical protein BK005_00015 [bacterium CG10_37_50]|nr:MAG: hypothetical protein BK005_00015 [bacterium CG10_37_50]
MDKQISDKEFVDSLRGRPPYSQKPFIVKYYGEERTVFAYSQEEANRIISIKEKRDLEKGNKES